MNMVEKVARALHAQEWEGQPGREPFSVARAYWMSAARAAIAAMREPTIEMSRRGEGAWMWRQLDNPDSEPIGDCYRAMIDAALANPPAGGENAR